MADRPPPTAAFRRLAGTFAILIGIGSIAYSVVFVLLIQTRSPALEAASWVLLLLGGLLTTGVLAQLYRELSDIEPGVALWALLLGTIGAVGSIVHGGFDVARLARPPGETATQVTQQLPNWVDPYGLLTFAVAGLSVVLFSWLVRRSPAFPNGLGTLGFVAGVLLVLVYLGRLVLYDPDNPALLAIAAITGVIANPAWFIWLGLTLRRVPERAA